MLSNIITILNLCIKYRLESLILIAIVFIVLFGIYCKITGKKGTWNVDYFHPKQIINKFKDINNSSSSKGEKKCKDVLEYFFNTPFEKSRPDFLFNPETGRNLEFDMFNIDLNLALEYQGRQHYEFIPFFHKNGMNDLYKQISHDQLKLDICRKLNINIIIVPYYVQISDISDFIYDELQKMNYNI